VSVKPSDQTFGIKMSSTQRNNAFGNGAFGSSRPSTSRITGTATMSGRPPVAPKGYVPPAMRQPTFDEMYPALGGKAVPVVKKTVLVEDTRPSLLKVVSDRVETDAIEAEIAAQREKRLALQVETDDAFGLPSFSRYYAVRAQRLAREERERYNKEMSLLCEHSSLFRSYIANTQRATSQHYYQEASRAYEERSEADDRSDAGSYDDAHTD
jgi:hypothetical protein